MESKEANHDQNDLLSSTTYQHKVFEKKWQSFWNEKKVFAVPSVSAKKSFTILMPPPNVTSKLHMGHGTTYTYQDIMIRRQRMLGKNAFWLPGTDHAGIATQMMVERELLESEGKKKEDLGRQAFVKRCEDWKEKYGGIIYDQFQTIGFSADYDRKSYTMDPHLSLAVRHVFHQLYSEGLIYRGERLVNWDPVLKTAISDDEIESKEVNGKLYHIRYAIENSEEFLTVATTRPETLLGDTAVCVNPEDERYRHLIGKSVIVPICGRRIPVIADDYVKVDFGTGALKITPAHDPNDFLIGKKHNLPFINVFDDNAQLNENTPEGWRGLDRFVAREKITQELKNQQLLEKQVSYRHTVPHSDRSKAVIEPKLSKQWFVKMESLARPAAEAARNGELCFYPDSWKKTYLHWLDHIEDWCISRQLWWGHQIPVYTCADCSHVFSSVEEPQNCTSCQSTKLQQDPDVLDTWFSSWLWPLSPLGWPDPKLMREKGFDQFYPSHVLVTAPEIIFLWVARMVMAGIKFTGKVPFKDVYLTAVVTDKNGVKFSKTLGNGIDPVEVIDTYGADAVRFTGVSMAPLGGRIMMDLTDFQNGARFVNKLWNASRFLHKLLNESNSQDRHFLQLSEATKDPIASWLIGRLGETSRKINELFDTYRLNEAIEVLYHFFWDDYCDWALESLKFYASSGEKSDFERVERLSSAVLYTFDSILRLSHPVMPYITEELWQNLPHHPDLKRSETICNAAYPTVENTFKPTGNGLQVTAGWEFVRSLIGAIRSARQQVNIPKKDRLEVSLFLTEQNQDILDSILNEKNFLSFQAGISSLKMITDKVLRPAKSLSSVGKGFTAFISVGDRIDLEKEKRRLETEQKRISGVVNGLKNKLANPSFSERAPAEVLEQTKTQLDNMLTQLSVVEESLRGF